MSHFLSTQPSLNAIFISSSISSFVSVSFNLIFCPISRSCLFNGSHARERQLDNPTPLPIWDKVFWNVLLKNKMIGRQMKGLELHKLYEILEKWEQDWVDRTSALTIPNIWIVVVKTQLLRGHTFLSKLWFLDAIALLAVEHYCQSHKSWKLKY